MKVGVRKWGSRGFRNIEKELKKKINTQNINVQFAC